MAYSRAKLKSSGDRASPAKRKLNMHVHPERQCIQKEGLAPGTPSSTVFVNTLFNSAVTC
jgi:hypothetical protein